MFGLTSIGVVHTAFSLVAWVGGIWLLARDKEISPRTGLGQVYLWTTVITCLTGFFIFQHGGFGKPHALGIITLLVLAVAAAAGRGLLGRASRYVETISYSLTLFFHFVPGLTETFTRLPAGSPVFSSPDDPGLQKLVGLSFLAFLVVATLQVRRLRATSSGSSMLGKLA